MVFLSRKLPCNSQTSALKLGAALTVETIAKSSQDVRFTLPKEMTPVVFC